MAVRLISGDCRAVLPTLPDESVHCVVTSPPYFGLRDYGTAQWDGGDPKCDHLERTAADVSKSNGLGKIAGYRDSLPSDNAAFRASARQFRATCGHCGASRIDRQIGLEPSPAEFVAELTAVFAELRRVLRKDGTAWLNIGDSYAGGGGNKLGTGNPGPQGSHRRVTNLKPKDLLGIPWRVAFALQADSWYLRQDIIWSKPNPMPESVTDRCTKAHEYLFLLSKSERYHYDQDAIAEEAVCPEGPGNTKPYRVAGERTGENANLGGNVHKIGPRETRNKRSVWEVATQPYADAHFATFPPALIEPCILAGCPKGGTVLDPFGGAGTTGLVADRLGRNAVLIELNPEYAAMAERRIRGDAPLFAEVALA